MQNICKLQTQNTKKMANTNRNAVKLTTTIVCGVFMWSKWRSKNRTGLADVMVVLFFFSRSFYSLIMQTTAQKLHIADRRHWLIFYILPFCSSGDKRFTCFLLLTTVSISSYYSHFSAFFPARNNARRCKIRNS